MTTTTITDDFMKQQLTTTKVYTIVLLKAGAQVPADAQQLIWEHARRNFQLRAEGTLSIVSPIMDHPVMRGIGFFNTDVAETKKIMDRDPAVSAGLFTYEICTGKSFPGDKLK